MVPPGVLELRSEQAFVVVAALFRLTCVKISAIQCLRRAKDVSHERTASKDKDEFGAATRSTAFGSEIAKFPARSACGEAGSGRM